MGCRHRRECGQGLTVLGMYGLLLLLLLLLIVLGWRRLSVEHVRVREHRKVAFEGLRGGRGSEGGITLARATRTGSNAKVLTRKAIVCGLHPARRVRMEKGVQRGAVPSNLR